MLLTCGRMRIHENSTTRLPSLFLEFVIIIVFNSCTSLSFRLILDKLYEPVSTSPVISTIVRRVLPNYQNQFTNVLSSRFHIKRPKKRFVSAVPEITVIRKFQICHYLLHRIPNTVRSPSIVSSETVFSEVTSSHGPNRLISRVVETDE